MIWACWLGSGGNVRVISIDIGRGVIKSAGLVMKDNDLYEAPDLRPGYQGNGTIIYEPLSALSLTQRLGRLRFACYQLTASVFAALLVILLMLVSQQLLPRAVGVVGSSVFIIVLSVYLVGLMVRRLHDMGKTGWWAIISLIPVMNVLFMLYLFLGNGDSTVNRFGTPNPPAGLLVLLVGGGYLVLNVLSLLLSLAVLITAWQFPEILHENMQKLTQRPPLTPW